MSNVNANKVKKELSKRKYEGKVFDSKSCGKFVVLEFNNAFDVRVKFLDTGYETTVASENMKRGMVKDHLIKHTNGIGYLGSKNATTGYKGLYQKWNSMITRCYSEHKDKAYYEGCIVSDNFLNFTKFRDWALEQKGHNLKVWVLDKDLLSDSGKIYSEETCCFIPHQLNVVFNKRFTESYDNIFVRENYGSFCVNISKFGEKHYLGCFKTKEEAKQAHLKAKIEYLAELAEIYKTDLEPKVYNKIVNWFK